MDLLNPVWDYLKDFTHVVELLSAITGVICVYLNTRENVWGWPIGIVSVGLAVYVYYQSFLFLDFLLNIIYVILGFYGWYEWLHGGEKKAALKVSLSSRRDLGLAALAGAAGTLILGFLFDTYTSAQLAYWDAFTTSYSLVAMVLMARKKLENWILWIIVDVVATGMYVYKGLFLFTALFAIYLLLAVKGHFDWKKSMQTTAEQDISKIGS